MFPENLEYISLFVIKFDPSGQTVTSVTESSQIISNGGAGTVADPFDVVALDSNTILIAYRDLAVAARTKAVVVGSISTSPTLGTTVTVQSTNATLIHCDFYDTTNDVLFVFQDTSSGNVFKLAQYTRSGNTLSAGTTSSFFTASASCTLKGFRRLGTGANFMVAYQDTTNTIGKVFVCTYDHSSHQFSVVGSTVNWPNSRQFTTGNLNAFDMASNVAGTNMVAAYIASDNSTYAICINVSGTVPTFKTETSAFGGNTGELCLTALNDRIYGVGTSTGVNAGQNKLLQASADLVTLTAVTTITSADTGAQCIGAIYVNPQAIITVRIDTSGPVGLTNVVTLTNTYMQTVGVVKSTVANASNVTVVTQGVSSSYSGLTVASPYFTDMGGAITASKNGIVNNDIIKIGVSQSTSSLVVQV